MALNKHIDSGGPTYPPEAVFVGLDTGTIYRIDGTTLAVIDTNGKVHNLKETAR